MFQIDKRMTEDSIAKFSTQSVHIRPDFIRMIEGHFVGDQTPEFYQGLVTGLAAAYQMAKMEGGQEIIAASIAVTSEHILQS